MWAADPSALVAKLLLASAGHGWTSLIALHPELALGALLEFSPSCKIHEGLILWVQPLVPPILLAAHVPVVLAPAFEAIISTAALTAELRNTLVILEYELAVWGWAPASISPIFLYVPIHLIAVVPVL